MSKHTPGPWLPLDGELSGMIIADSPDHPVAEVRGWGWLQKKGKAGEEEQDANLRLIAAAPDMLAALRAVEARHVEQNALRGRDESRSTTLRLVRDAIARATAP